MSPWPGLRLATLHSDTEMLGVARGAAEQLISASVESGRENRDPQSGEEIEATKEVRGVVRYIQEHWQRRYGLVQVG